MHLSFLPQVCALHFPLLSFCLSSGSGTSSTPWSILRCLSGQPVSVWLVLWQGTIFVAAALKMRTLFLSHAGGNCMRAWQDGATVTEIPPTQGYSPLRAEVTWLGRSKSRCIPERNKSQNCKMTAVRFSDELAAAVINHLKHGGYYKYHPASTIYTLPTV
jgi:hypothetical protein